MNRYVAIFDPNNAVVDIGEILDYLDYTEGYELYTVKVQLTNGLIAKVCCSEEDIKASKEEAFAYLYQDIFEWNNDNLNLYIQFMNKLGEIYNV